jgi:hypothetical protein
MKIIKGFFEKVKNLKYLDTTVTNNNYSLTKLTTTKVHNQYSQVSGTGPCPEPTGSNLL